MKYTFNVIEKVVFSLIPLFLFYSCSGNKDVISVTARQFQVPVLKNKDDNPVLQIKIKVNESKKSMVVNSFKVSLSGTDDLDDIKYVKILFMGKDSLWPRRHSEQLLYDKRMSPGVSVKFSGEQVLSEGDNYFWIVCDLENSAGLQNKVDASCSVVNIKGKGKYRPQEINTDIRLRTGIALRDHMDDNVDTYRIPGLTTTKKGTLLAIYDVRRQSSRDLQGDIDIGLSRSTDGGNTWEPMQIVLDMDEWGGLPQKFNGVSDACILADIITGKLFIAGLWMHGVLDSTGKWIEGLSETSTEWEHQWRRKGSQSGFDEKQTSQFLVTESIDDGVTWSKPVNITRMCKRPEWWLLAPAPGNGITLDDGTLVFPTQGRDENGIPFSNITYSKDNGITWVTSNPAFSGTNECAVVQLKSKTLMLNMRYGQRKPGEKGRKVFTTNNLGETWSEHPSSGKILTEPVCMGSLIKHTYTEHGNNKEILLFSNPNVERNPRKNITIKVSFDHGTTWPEKYYMLLDEGTGRGYSCLTSINEKTIGILYESSQANLVFESIPLEELINK